MMTVEYGQRWRWFDSSGNVLHFLTDLEQRRLTEITDGVLNAGEQRANYVPN